MDANKKQYRVAAVTGATGAIGGAIAEGIAARPGYEIVLLVRDEAKARKTAATIQRKTGAERVSFRLVDTAQRESIEKLARTWQGPLHVLINNAAATPRRRQVTPAGIERQFATNVLGYFWLIQAFRKILAQSTPARVVNVASYWAGGLELEDLEFQRRPYRNGAAYRQSKQADRMLSAAFARRLEPAGITVNACHPGDVNSQLSNDLGFGGFESPTQGADTPVWLATAPELESVTGQYFENRRSVRDRFAEDTRAVEALFQACLAY